MLPSVSVTRLLALLLPLIAVGLDPGHRFRGTQRMMDCMGSNAPNGWRSLPDAVGTPWDAVSRNPGKRMRIQSLTSPVALTPPERDNTPWHSAAFRRAPRFPEVGSLARGARPRRPSRSSTRGWPTARTWRDKPTSARHRSPTGCAAAGRCPGRCPSGSRLMAVHRRTAGRRLSAIEIDGGVGSIRRGRRPGRWRRTRCQLHCPNPVQAAGTSAVTHRHLEGDLERVQIHDRDTVRGSQPQIGA